MRRVEQAVPLALARTRALRYLAKEHRLTLSKASSVAYSIWPDTKFTSQGAGGAASRILRGLQKDGLAKWTSDDRDWGWVITELGRSGLKALAKGKA